MHYNNQKTMYRYMKGYVKNLTIDVGFRFWTAVGKVYQETNGSKKSAIFAYCGVAIPKELEINISWI